MTKIATIDDLLKEVAKQSGDTMKVSPLTGALWQFGEFLFIYTGAKWVQVVDEPVDR